MKIVKIITLVLILALVGIQFAPTTRNQSNDVPNGDFMLVNDVPTYIVNKLQNSCYDCHSNNTAYPWYNKVQPAAWFLESHIKKGKAELNFNEWAEYSDRKKRGKLKSIISQVEDDEMPLKSYVLIHKNARFSEEDKKKVNEWMAKLKDSL